MNKREKWLPQQKETGQEDLFGQPSPVQRDIMEIAKSVNFKLGREIELRAERGRFYRGIHTQKEIEEFEKYLKAEREKIKFTPEEQSFYDEKYGFRKRKKGVE